MKSLVHFLKKATILGVLIAFTSGCDDDPEICSTVQEEAVVTQLAATLDNCGCEISVARGTYLGNTVYYFMNTSPNCLMVFNPTLYNCDGNIVQSLIELDQNRFERLVKFDEILYRCND